MEAKSEIKTKNNNSKRFGKNKFKFEKFPESGFPTMAWDSGPFVKPKLLERPIQR